MAALIVNSTVTGFQNMVNLAGKVGSVEYDIGAVLLNRIKARFLAETDPDGVRWPKSHAAIERAKSGRDGGTLFDTGTLFHSIKAVLKEDGTLSIQTDVPYAVNHQEGYDGFAAIPKRVFLGFSREDELLARELMEERIRETIGG
jgi:phage gpG-like protein